jgi:hypothetical protein
MDPAKWAAFAGWMADHGLIKSVPETGEVLSNELLPPAG